MCLFIISVPINIEETEGIEVIDKKKVSNIGQTSFTLHLKTAFFNQRQNGIPVEDGIIACAEYKHNYPGVY